MTPLAGQIAPGEDPVLTGRTASLTRDQLKGSDRAGTPLPRDARVALAIGDPVTLISTLAALDGQVAALLLISAAQPGETRAALAAAAGADVLISEDGAGGDGLNALTPDTIAPADTTSDPVPTDWLLTTSGTTGLPKIVPHNLSSLSRSVYRFGPAQTPPVWGLLYDPTRFAGLQVVLQALIGGGRLVVADTHAPVADQIAMLANAGVTHLSATPTLWRRILMAPGHRALPLRQVTLGGEICDQPVLDALKSAFPDARLSHIYASTEAGVGFSVTDGRAGFPTAYLGGAPGGVALRIADGILWLKPPVSALGQSLPGIEVDADGFVRSGDRVSDDGTRIRFLGRDSGLINVGGVKVVPETVEAVVRGVPGVAQVRISSKTSPVTGALVVAEVQAAPDTDPADLKKRIQAASRATLEREAVPALIRFVDGFTLNTAGKLERKETLT